MKWNYDEVLDNFLTVGGNSFVQLQANTSIILIFNQTDEISILSNYIVS